MVVVDEFDREMPSFDDQLVEKSVLKPDLVVCLNPLENYVMLHECGLAGIPTIGIIDTDANPTWVTYPIPANDDSIRCVQVIAGVLGRAGEAGQRRRKAAALRGHVTYSFLHGLNPPTGEESQIDAQHRRMIEEERKLFEEEQEGVDSHASQVPAGEAAGDAALREDLAAAEDSARRANPAGQQMGVNVNSENAEPEEEVEEHFGHQTSLDDAAEQVRENRK